MATLEMIAPVAVVPEGSCVPASAGHAAAAMLARIRQPCRKAGQFVIIAVLLDWSKFAYSPGVPWACRMHPCPLHGRKRHPSKSFPPTRRRDDLLRGENRCAPVDSKPRRSFHWGLSQFRQDEAC